MRVYSTQSVGFYEELLRDGIAFCRKEGYWCQHYRFQYDWMAEQMRKLIGEPPISEIRYPVWVWQQYNSKKNPVPPMTPKDIPDEEEEAVMMELEVPDEAVLLSDLDLWIGPLNGADICSKKESKLLDKEMDAYEKEHGRCDRISDWPPEIRDKIVASWERIFDLDWRDPYQKMCMRRNRAIQGTLWLLRKEWLVTARFYNRHSEIKRISFAKG